MKYILLLFPLFSFAQTKKTSDHPFEGAKKIVVLVKDTTGIFEKVENSLLNSGYTFTVADKNDKFLVTDLKTQKDGTRMKIRAHVRDSSVVFDGFYPLDDNDNGGTLISVNGQSETRKPESVIYKGQKGSPFMNAWQELTRAASAIGGKRIYSE
jgi:hypothetical protein